MTKQDAQRLLPLIQAYAEGKTIQRRHGDTLWQDLDTPNFTCDADEYRVKPEPEPVQMAPLEVTDFPPGSVIRESCWPEGVYWSPIKVLTTGLHFGQGTGGLSWEEMRREGLQIKRPGEDWQPCCKPATPNPSAP